MQKSYIPLNHRPRCDGAILDASHDSYIKMSLHDCFFDDSDPHRYHAIIIGPRHDKVLALIAHHINPDDKIKILFLEEMFSSWSFISNDGLMHFIISSDNKINRAIQPDLVYFRSAYPGPSDTHQHNLSNLANFLNDWPGLVLCRPIQHHLNHSKLLQHKRSIIKAINKTGANIRIPESHIIKGKRAFNQLPLQELVVKPLSSQRADIVDANTFNQWDKQALETMPVLFQKIVSGVDIRVHKLFDKIVALRIPKVTVLNYRYDTRSSQLEAVTLDQKTIDFCHAVSTIEKNPLLGIDLYEMDDGYCCFEANPGPGWSAFHENEADDGKSFLSYFMQVLRHGHT